jgi:hypothetical protein
MTYKLTLPGTFSDTTLPYFKIDPVLPDDGGALFLIDPQHPVSPWAAGVPADSTSIPNIASAQAADTLGGPGGTQYPFTFRIGGAINNGTNGIVERSTKGGLHGIVSQAQPLTSGDGVAFGIPTAIETYLAANNDHRFYMSQWDVITRVNTGTLATNAAVQAGVLSSGTILARIRADGFRGASNSVPTGVLLPAANAVGNRFAACATVANANVSSSTNWSGPFWGAFAGTHNASAIASYNTHWPSFVFYRFYLEDLTVSGRTFEEVSAVDYDLYTQDVLTPGGRYYGDSYTAASTVA